MRGVEAAGINDKGEIVGGYHTSNGLLGFLYSGGKYTTIDVSGSSSTAAAGINNKGEIVGNYTNSLGVEFGFLYIVAAPSFMVGNLDLIGFPRLTCSAASTSIFLLVPRSASFGYQAFLATTPLLKSTFRPGRFPGPCPSFVCHSR